MKTGYKGVISILAMSLVLLLAGCTTTRHVPEGKYLLDKLKIEINDSIYPSHIGSSELANYVRQKPNHKVLGCLKLQLMTYDLSGKDSTKWYNRWFRRLGRPPVIFDESLAEASAKQLRLALLNRGYMDAAVQIDTVARPQKKKLNITYRVTPGRPHTVRKIDYDIYDSAVARILFADTALFSIKSGNLFDRNKIDAERLRITEQLQNRGYYSFVKENITFIADTAAGSKDVDITMVLREPRRTGVGQAIPTAHTQIADTADTRPHHAVYKVRNVVFVTDYQPGEPIDQYAHAINDSSTVSYRGIYVIYGNDRYLTPRILWENCYIDPGQVYSSRQFDRTYEALGRLGIIKSVNINLLPVADIDGSYWLDAFVLLSRGKKQGITLEVEGTNSEGDFGFGIGATYQHRNISKESNLLTAKLRGSYESLSGNFSDLINNRYTEFAGEVGITFPRFMAPLLSRDFKRKVRASSEFAISGNYQERPEYTRIIAGAAWKYKWNDRNNSTRRTFDLVDINYVYLPRSTINFLDSVAPDNPLLRYSYEDHLIMRMGYSFYKTNKYMPAAGSITTARFQPNIYTLRTSIETAGNLLYGISAAIGAKRQDGAYKVLGIQYAQYVKGEIDYMLSHHFDTRNSIAFHAGFGIGIPYGNSSMLPFEKRFYAGGANGVRGWNVRTLGPGRYDSRNSVTNFINQCGDIRIDLNVEYRAKLFWVLEGALFIDGGNIWTIREYENQPGGLFRFDSFYKELAWAYGIGLRLDFKYFLMRLDLGMKAYNPAYNQERWPLIHPRWGRDSAFHFSVGYPF